MTDYKIKLLDLDNEINSIQNLLKQSITEQIKDSPSKKYQVRKNSDNEIEIVAKTIKSQEFVDNV